MISITSERHKISFYLSIILGSLFFLGICFVLLITFREKWEAGELEPKDNFIPIGCILILALSVYTIYRYYKNAPKITIDNDLISFNSKSFPLRDIQHIELTGKQNFPYIFNFPMEAATVRFTDGTTKHIFDDMYQNAWEIKSFLKQVVIDKKTYIELESHKIDGSELEYEEYQNFKGNQFTSLRGICLWTLIGFFGYMILNNKKPNTNGLLIFFLLFSMAWFLFNS